MNVRDMRERLVHAEMHFAAFNARRTGAGSGDDVVRQTHPAYELVLDPSRPSSTYYNRVSLQPHVPFDAAALDGLPPAVRAIEATPAHLDGDLSARLAAQGFAPAYALCYLAWVPSQARFDAPSVERLETTQTDLFFDLLQLEGVEFGAEKRAAKRGYYCTPQFQAFIARAHDGRVAGWSTMFVGETSAFLGNSFVLPAYRRSGHHAALLAARQNAMAEMNLAFAFTDVEFGSQSHDNCERAGFRPLTVNTIWARA